MATVAAKPPTSARPEVLKLESLASIDISTLSQTELQALSLCSSSAFDLRSTHELVVPKVDRSLFNESAGSRRQTYSRPHRTQSGSPTGHRRRVAGLLPTPKLPPVPADDPENIENRKIIDYLKQLIREDPNFNQVELTPPSISTVDVTNAQPRDDVGLMRLGEERKRKRGRKPKVKVHLEECYRGMEIVNKNGAAIDLSALINVEDPFAEELRRRTAGLQTEEELLGFLRDLGGEWGSRRKKRKIVDAGDFGDILPVGWKLLLGLKRKDGRAWIYCRRYISPSGQHFVSCKEVSSHLQSLFGPHDKQLPINRRGENVLHDNRVITESSAGVTYEDQDQRHFVATNSTVPNSSLPYERVKEVALLGIDNLADVQIHDLFECHKCSMTFDEKDTYLQHLLSFHQRTTRRYRLGSSVGDGVIIKDGKFECQFCHKVFLERRRYNGHVGIHVRNYVRRVEESPAQSNVQRRDKSPVREDLPSRISKMDALIEIAQHSIMENSAMKPHSQIKDGSSPDKVNVIPSDIFVGNLNQDINFKSPLFVQQMEDDMDEDDKIVDPDINQQDSQNVLDDGKVEKLFGGNEVDAKMSTCLETTCLLSVNKENVNASDAFKGKDDVAMTVDGLGFDQSRVDLDGVSQISLLSSSGNHVIPESESNKDSSCANTKEQFKLDDDNRNESELEIGLGGSKDISVGSNVQGMVMSASEEDTVKPGVSNPPMSMVQSLGCLPTFSGLSDKGGKQFCSVDVNEFQELRLDGIETPKDNFASGQDSLLLPDVPIDLVDNTGMEGAYASSVQFKSQELMSNVAVRYQLTTLCV